MAANKEMVEFVEELEILMVKHGVVSARYDAKLEVLHNGEPGMLYELGFSCDAAHHDKPIIHNSTVTLIRQKEDFTTMEDEEHPDSTED